MLSTADLVRAVLMLAWCTSCAHHNNSPTPQATASSRAKPPPPLTRLAASTLADAYAGGGADADATYRGKRFTVFGDVVSVDVDAGEHHLVFGSKLRPLIATGVDEGAASALVVGATIEIDCTVTGAIAEIPTIDCGPNGVPRALSPPP